MPKGKVPESEDFKKAFESFNALKEKEKSVFHSKVFSRLCKDLTDEQKKEVKDARKAILKKIASWNKKTLQAQCQSINSVPTEVLERIIEERKKKKVK